MRFEICLDIQNVLCYIMLLPNNSYTRSWIPSQLKGILKSNKGIPTTQLGITTQKTWLLFCLYVFPQHSIDIFWMKILF